MFAKKGEPYYVLFLDLEDSLTCHGKMKTKEFLFCIILPLFWFDGDSKTFASTNPNLKHLESYHWWCFVSYVGNVSFNALI
jgi:hypothetical protein